MISLLEAALAPIEPPADLGNRLEVRLTEMKEAAFEELTDWEMAAMRDPRNWIRPAAAIAVGTAAGAALVVLRMRQSRRQRTGLRGLADQGRREVMGAIADARERIR